MQKSQLLGNVASTMAIAYIGDQYIRHYGPRAVLKIREWKYGDRCDKLHAVYMEACNSATLDAEYRWTTSVEPAAKQYLAEREVQSGNQFPDSGADLLESLRRQYVMYVIAVATRTQWLQFIELEAKRRTLKPAVHINHASKRLLEQICTLHEHLAKVFAGDHLIVEPVSV